MKKFAILLMLMFSAAVSALDADSLKVAADSAFAKEDYKAAEIERDSRK